MTYELSQSKESARAAYDSVRSEKEELKLELVKYAERRKAMETELEHARKLAATYSSNVDDLKNQLEISESQNKNLHQGNQPVRIKNSYLILYSCRATYAYNDKISRLEKYYDDIGKRTRYVERTKSNVNSTI